MNARAALLGLAALSACGRAAENAPEASDPSQGLRTDRRMLELLADCAQSGFYDRDLSDMVPVLLGKIEHARPDALKRAKEELGALGAQAFPALGNRFHAYYTDQIRSAYLENVVDALTFNPSDEAHELLLESLRHPQESVRTKALDGLARLARPEDFDVLVERLAIETRELRRQSVTALFTADRSRAEELFLDFMTRGVERDLWLAAGPQFALSTSAATAHRCADLLQGVDALLSAHLAAAAARFDLEVGLAHLRAELRAPELPRRLNAATALQRAGLVDELGSALLEDASVEVRAIAAAAFGDVELSEERRTWLRTALNDPSPAVQAEALAVLCSRDDEEGLARAVALLDAAGTQLQAALLALRPRLKRDPEFTRATFERLLARHALEEHRPIQQRTATFKAIGQMPCREAAEFLHRVGVNAGAEELESLRAHDWLMIQASNTGIEGRTFLAEALRTETDALRRIDLIDALGSARDDLARTQLLELTEHSARSPLERLFAASALIRVGPSWEVAPRLKRVAYAMQAPADAEARAALQCLLWQWF